MAIYDLYEVTASSLQEAKKFVEQAGILLEERESGYHRGSYFACGEIGQENFELKINLDPYDDVPNEDDFPSSKFLLYINNTTRSDELKMKFSTSSDRLVLLRHENFD